MTREAASSTAWRNRPLICWFFATIFAWLVVWMDGTKKQQAANPTHRRVVVLLVEG
jgi:hypothetical protein